MATKKTKKQVRQNAIAKLPLRYVAIILIVVSGLALLLNRALPSNEPDRQALPTATSNTIPSLCSDLRFSPAGWVQEGGIVKRNIACTGGSDGGYIGACPCADDYVAVMQNGTPIFYTTTPQGSTVMPSSPTWTVTITKTFTPTLTVTPSRTPTQTASKTPTVTPSQTATVTPSRTPTSTFTMTPSPTFTSTFTSTSSPTVIPSPTPTLQITIAFDVTINYRGKDIKGYIKLLNIRSTTSTSLPKIGDLDPCMGDVAQCAHWSIEKVIPVGNDRWGKLTFQPGFIPLYYNGIYYTNWRPAP